MYATLPMKTAVNGLVEQIEEEVGVIDILVNNAGIIKRIPMCDMTAELSSDRLSMWT